MKPTKEAVRLLFDGAKCLADVEASGIRIDVDTLRANIKSAEAQAIALEQELKRDPIWAAWRRKYGDTAKLSSSVQLGEIVFGDMGLPCLERTETGRPSTEGTSLLKTGLPFCKTYVEMGTLRKAISTFLLGILTALDSDGYLHPSFHLHKAVSGRSSSSGPNFQNWPNRNPKLAKLIRECFVPRPGRRLVEIDFKGVEVSVSCCYHKDPALIRYVSDPSTDMHRDKAMELFFLKKEQVEKRTTRDWSKNRFVFPQFYGSVYFQCAPHLWEAVVAPGSKLADGTPIREHLRKNGVHELGECDPKKPPQPGTFEARVKQVEDWMWDRDFTAFTAWKKRRWEEYQRQGWISSLTGFVFNWGTSGVLERNDVLNYGTQGAAFHCLLWCLIEAHKWLRKNRMKTLIVGQIHDSVLLDVPECELQDVLNKVVALMAHDLREAWKWIIVPMGVEADVSEVDGNWYEKHSWQPNNSGVWCPAAA